MRLARALAPAGLCFSVGFSVGLSLGIAAGCNLIFGVVDYEVASGTASGGAGGAGASEGANAPCLANEVDACYEGPEGTLDVGTCSAGEAVCQEDGSGFGPCQDQVLPALEDCASLPDEDCNGSECGEPMWLKTVAGADQQVVTGIAATDEAVFVTGYYRTSAAVGAKSLQSLDVEDGFVAKLNDASMGGCAWLVGLRGMDAQRPEDIAVDPNGNVVVVGHYRVQLEVGGPSGNLYSANGLEPDIFVTKLEAMNGDEVWTRTYGSANADRAYGVAVSANNDIAVVGDFGGPIDFGPDPPLDGSAPFSELFAFVADSDGTVRWILALGGSDSVSANAVTFLGDSIGVAATFSGTVDVGVDLTAAGQDGLAIVASEGVAPAATIDDYHHIAGGGVQLPVAAGSLDGDLLIAGQFGGSIDFGDGGRSSAGFTDVFIVRYPPSPAVPQYRILSNAGDATLGSFDVDSEGEITLVGAFSGDLDVAGTVLGPAEGGLDIFVAKLDSQLGVRFGAFYGDDDNQAATDVAVSPDRSLLVGGWFFGVLTIDGFQGAMADDGFITKMAY